MKQTQRKEKITDKQHLAWIIEEAESFGEASFELQEVGFATKSFPSSTSLLQQLKKRAAAIDLLVIDTFRYADELPTLLSTIERGQKTVPKVLCSRILERGSVPTADIPILRSFLSREKQFETLVNQLLDTTYTDARRKTRRVDVKFDVVFVTEAGVRAEAQGNNLSLGGMHATIPLQNLQVGDLMQFSIPSQTAGVLPVTGVVEVRWIERLVSTRGSVGAGLRILRCVFDQKGGSL